MPGPNQVKWGNGSHYCVITLTAESTHRLPKTPHPPLLPRLLPSKPVEAVVGRDFSFIASSQRLPPTYYKSCYLPIIIMPGPNQVKWGNGSHYCVITLTAPSTESPAEDTSSSPSTPNTTI
ncbi:hypothetical protein H4Q26_017890 [Puccinia striiformis f. sp. tritici PST-130]|nr:hypothetical protein H4Q26_017890 [Puccinia striiformis f. sp. tritici PST-130]